MTDPSIFFARKFLSVLGQLRSAVEGMLRLHGFVPVTPESARHDSFEFVFWRSDGGADRFIRVVLHPQGPSRRMLRGSFVASPVRAIIEIWAGVERENLNAGTRVAVWRVDVRDDSTFRYYTFLKDFEPALSHAIDIVSTESFNLDPDRLHRSEPAGR
jgi:hypothetical protein